ncbi:hypothetical protein WJX84_007697, partial [Apatococcus fuscideae]
MAALSEAAKQSEMSNAELKQRLEAMAQVQQETLKSNGAESVYESLSNGESNGPRNTSSANSHSNEKEKARRAALQKRVGQLEAANQELTRSLEEKRRELQVAPGILCGS